MSWEKKIIIKLSYQTLRDILLISEQYIKSDYIIAYGIHVSSFQIIYACHKLIYLIIKEERS